MARSLDPAGAGTGPRSLAPCDLQPIKACGVTFAGSMVERVIEERAKGDPARATLLRTQLANTIGNRLGELRPGSPEAMRAKQVLIAEGLWSQYLRSASARTRKCSPRRRCCPRWVPVPRSASSQPPPGTIRSRRWCWRWTPRGGYAAPRSATTSTCTNVEGRSALLLGKAKDNNASCAIGPFPRLFDAGFELDHVRNLALSLVVTGAENGFELRGHSSMREISRDPEDLVAQTIGAHHQYPDGVMLFLGTLFAPLQDRDTPAAASSTSSATGWKPRHRHSAGWSTG